MKLRGYTACVALVGILGRLALARRRALLAFHDAEDHAVRATIHDLAQLAYSLAGVPAPAPVPMPDAPIHPGCTCDAGAGVAALLHAASCPLRKGAN